jgi:hypothetical protein
MKTLTSQNINVGVGPMNRESGRYQGKPKKVAISAFVRKMVVILNSMVRDGEK